MDDVMTAVRDGATVRAFALEAVLRARDEAATLPRAFYASEEIFRVEQEELFGRMWQCVARAEDIAEIGDYVTRSVAGEPVLVIRDHDGRVRAFYNVCRHRGSRLLDDDRGNAGRCIRCPYHAWSYRLDGQLMGAPMMDGAHGFRKRDYPLVELRLDTWEGFVFVNLDEDTEPLGEWMSDFPDLSRYRMAELRRGHRIVYDVAANWKLLCENYAECYHCALAHPQLNEISHFLSGGRSVVGSCFCGGPMDLNEGIETMSVDGHSDIPPISGLPEEDRRQIHYFNLFPNLLLSLHPDYVLTHHLWPRALDRTEIVCDFYFTQEALEQEGFDPSGPVEFWDLTNRQDWQLCERAQAGVRSRGYRQGRYQGIESSVHNFDRWIVGALEPHLRERGLVAEA